MVCVDVRDIKSLTCKERESLTRDEVDEWLFNMDERADQKGFMI